MIRLGKYLRTGARLLAISFLLLSQSNLSFGAIAFDSASTNTADDVSSLTISHTVTGSNTILVVCSAVEGTTSGNQPITGITYNGVALTKIHDIAGSANNRTEQWYLVAPSSGANDIVITYTGVVGSGAGQGVAGAGLSITGAKQQAPEASAEASGSSSTATVNVTTLTNNAWVTDCTYSGLAANTLTVGADQTSRFNFENAGSHDTAGSTEPKATAGSVTSSWTISGSGAWGIINSAWEEVVVTDGWVTNDSKLEDIYVF